VDFVFVGGVFVWGERLFCSFGVVGWVNWDCGCGEKWTLLLKKVRMEVGELVLWRRREEKKT